MTRLYIQPSFVDSCSDHGEWSGGNDQYRGDRSVEVVPTYINGRPNVRAFSDEAIEARRAKKPTKVPLKQRILPQSARVEKLRSEILELETAYRAGEFTPEEYTLLRDVQFKKLRRAEELLKKAITPVKTEDEYEEVIVENAYETDDLDHINRPVAAKQSNPSWVVDFIDELSSTNSFRKPLKIACTVVMKALQLSQQAKAYYQTLKEV